MTIEIAGKQVLITSPCSKSEVESVNRDYITRKIGEGIVGGALIGIQGDWRIVSKTVDKPTERMNVLEEANSLIYGDRQEAYGSATKNFGDTARMWSVIAGVEITGKQVALMMAAMKICRQLHREKRDNIVDCAGYLGCYEKIENGD